MPHKPLAAPLSMAQFPILTRVYRTQWRGKNSFWLLFLLAYGCAAFFLLRYALAATEPIAGRDMDAQLRALGQSLWLQMAWIQTALALLLPPTLSAGLIARERERGLLDGLLMAPLSPARIALEKWAGALAPFFVLFAILIPFDIVAIGLGAQSARALGAVVGFQILLAAAGAAMGLACSAWARRAHLANRSAYGVLTVWVLASTAAAFANGDSALGRLVPGYLPPPFIGWLGHTNPLLGAYDLIMPDAPGNYWAGATLTLLALLMLSLWSALRALRQPLAEAPFIADSQANIARKKRAQGAGVPEHFEVPFVGTLSFSNPVMGREVRSKFRLRQPPLGVILVEGVLALAVAYFYGRTLWTALTDPSTRSIIFWGVTITGFIVTLMSCAIMGANSFSREHEGGTWESVRLSLLRPRELVRGKAGGILWVCLLFSIPVWPLLLPCVSWNLPWQSMGAGRDQIAVSQLGAVIAIWIGSALATTMWGLWWGRRTRKTSAASGAALGTSAAWLIGIPVGLLFANQSRAEMILMWINPFGALVATGSFWFGGFSALGLPFLAAALTFGVLIGLEMERDMKREFGRSVSHKGHEDLTKGHKEVLGD